MKYLFVFLYVGLMIGCGNDATQEASEVVSDDRKVNLNTETVEQPNCDTIEGLQLVDINDVPDTYSGIAFECYNGKVSGMGNFKNGKFNGLVRSWWDNGQIEGEAYLKNGKLQGIVRSWSPNGTRDAEINYNDGQMDGFFTAWDNNDNLRYKRNYKKGKQDGLQRSWHTNGVLKKESNYKDGELLNSKCWDEEGKEIECPE